MSFLTYIEHMWEGLWFHCDLPHAFMLPVVCKQFRDSYNANKVTRCWTSIDYKQMHSLYFLLHHVLSTESYSYTEKMLMANKVGRFIRFSTSCFEQVNYLLKRFAEKMTPEYLDSWEVPDETKLPHRFNIESGMYPQPGFKFNVKGWPLETERLAFVADFDQFLEHWKRPLQQVFKNELTLKYDKNMGLVEYYVEMGDIDTVSLLLQVDPMAVQLSFGRDQHGLLHTLAKSKHSKSTEMGRLIVDRMQYANQIDMRPRCYKKALSMLNWQGERKYFRGEVSTVNYDFIYINLENERAPQIQPLNRAMSTGDINLVDFFLEFEAAEFVINLPVEVRIWTDNHFFKHQGFQPKLDFKSTYLFEAIHWFSHWIEDKSEMSFALSR